MTWVRSLDLRQQRSRPVAFVVAVTMKFVEDGAGRLAGLLAFYAFLSIFPLLLVFVTILSLVLPGHEAVQNQVLRSALGDFPVIGDQMRLQGLHGEWWVLPVSFLFTLWGARGVAVALQQALNTIWNVPIGERPGILADLARGFGLLTALALGVAVTGFLSGVGGWGGAESIGLRIAAIVASTAASVGAFVLVFRLAIARYVPTRELIRGAIASAIGWQVLLATGGLLVSKVVNHAQSVYGVFGLVLGLLTWLHLQASLTLLAAESDVVRARRLWPRSLITPPLTGADKRALTDYATTQRRLPDDEQRVRVSFADEPGVVHGDENGSTGVSNAVSGHELIEGG